MRWFGNFWEKYAIVLAAFFFLTSFLLNSQFLGAAVAAYAFSNFTLIANRERLRLHRFKFLERYQLVVLGLILILLGINLLNDSPSLLTVLLAFFLGICLAAGYLFQFEDRSFEVKSSKVL